MVNSVNEALLQRKRQKKQCETTADKCGRDGGGGGDCCYFICTHTNYELHEQSMCTNKYFLVRAPCFLSLSPTLFFIARSPHYLLFYQRQHTKFFFFFNYIVMMANVGYIYWASVRPTSMQYEMLARKYLSRSNKKIAQFLVRASLHTHRAMRAVV